MFLEKLRMGCKSSVPATKQKAQKLSHTCIHNELKMSEFDRKHSRLSPKNLNLIFTGTKFFKQEDYFVFSQVLGRLKILRLLNALVFLTSYSTIGLKKKFAKALGIKRYFEF